MTDKPEFVKYRPAKNGEAPPYWRDEMKAETTVNGARHACPDPAWVRNGLYHVPSKSIFDAQAWLKEGRAHREQVEALGVTLPEPVDPYVALWADILELFGKSWRDKFEKAGPDVVDNQGLALLRARCPNLGEG